MQDLHENLPKDLHVVDNIAEVLVDCRFCESEQVWRLLYQASRDGPTADKFHHHCDGFAPTYVVILVNNSFMLQVT